MRTALEFKTARALWLRAGGLVCGAILAALASASVSMAQSGAVQNAPQTDSLAAAVSGPEALAKSAPAELTGVVVQATRPKPIPLSEVDVVAKPRATPVDGLVVTATRTCPSPKSPPDRRAPQPHLKSTYPANGARVAPGFVVLRLTFDVPMACRGSLPQFLLAGCYSEDGEIWHISADKRSLLILCKLKPKTRYWVSINRRIPVHFKALSGLEPEGGDLYFWTSGAAPIETRDGLVGRDLQLAALLSAAGPAKPAPAQDTVQGDGAPTRVASLRVEATTACLPPRDPPDRAVPPPKVVSTFPARGQTVAPGLLELRFTFDLPMACAGGVEVTGGSANPCMLLMKDRNVSRAEHWIYNWDRHTLRLLCRVEPGEHYTVRLNKTASWPDFKGLGGSKAPPFELVFATSNGPPIQTWDDAEVEDPMMAALIEGRETDREPPKPPDG